MNAVTLMGHLTADPEQRFTPTGQAVVEFTVAVNDDYKDKAGNKVERAYFFSCHCWGARGEAFAKYHKKGSKALVSGKLTQDTWEDKTTGKKQSKTRVNVLEWHFVGSKPSGDAPAAPRPARPAPEPEAAPKADLPEDDVPF